MATGDKTKWESGSVVSWEDLQHTIDLMDKAASSSSVTNDKTRYRFDFRTRYVNPYDPRFITPVYYTPALEGMEYIRQCRNNGESWLSIARELIADHLANNLMFYIPIFVGIQCWWLVTVWSGIYARG